MSRGLTDIPYQRGEKGYQIHILRSNTCRRWHLMVREGISEKGYHSKNLQGFIERGDGTGIYTPSGKVSPPPEISHS